MYSPLQIRPDLEEDPTTDCDRYYQKIFKVIRRFFLHLDVPYGRRSLEAGLRGRPEFPSAEWLEFGVDTVVAQQLLTVFQNELDLPNHFLTPRDSLQIVMIPSFNSEFPHSSVRLGLREAFGVDVEDETFRMAHHEGWKIGYLIRYIVDKSSETQGVTNA